MVNFRRGQAAASPRLVCLRTNASARERVLPGPRERFHLTRSLLAAALIGHQSNERTRTGTCVL